MRSTHVLVLWVLRYKQKEYWDFRFASETTYDWLGDVDAVGIRQVSCLVPSGDSLLGANRRCVGGL